jgi:hypothetical protein
MKDAWRARSGGKTLPAAEIPSRLPGQRRRYFYRNGKDPHAMPTDDKVKAEKVLEINASHPVSRRIESAFDGDKDKVKQYPSCFTIRRSSSRGCPSRIRSRSPI